MWVCVHVLVYGIPLTGGTFCSPPLPFFLSFLVFDLIVSPVCLVAASNVFTELGTMDFNLGGDFDFDIVPYGPTCVFVCVCCV